MAVSFSKKIVRRYFVNETQDGHLDFVFPPYNDKALQAGILEMLKTSNNVRRGLQGDDMEIQARVKFFDDHCQDVINLTWEQGGVEEPCNAQTCPGWKDQVPPDIKASVAGYFQQKITLSAETAKN